MADFSPTKGGGQQGNAGRRLQFDWHERSQAAQRGTFGTVLTRADAVDAIRAHSETLLAELASWEALARSTGFGPNQT